MRIGRALAAACVAAALGPAPLSADPQPVAAPNPPSALARLALAAASQLSAASPEPPVAVYVGGESAELAREFGTLLISELANRRMAPLPVGAPSAEAAEPTARERGARSLARLSVGLSDGAVQARGDLISTWVNFWSGQAQTRSGRPAAVILAAIEADAQALALASADSLSGSGRLRLESAHLADVPMWTAALAAGDLDGDGRDEIVALTDAEILAFSSEGKLLARREHRALGDSPTPCREPFGAISIQSQRVAYFSAARRKGELLVLDKARAELRAVGQLDEAPVAAQGQTQLWGAFLPGRSAFAAEVRSASGERWSLPGPFWTVSLFAAGDRARSLVAFADGTASFATGLGHGRAPAFRHGAAAMALIDVDGDGEPEIVTTSPRYRPEEDELRILEAPAATAAATAGAAVGRRAAGENAKELWHGSIRGGWALQVVGARLGGGRGAQIVVGLWKPDGSGQLQIFRQVSP